VIFPNPVLFNPFTVMTLISAHGWCVSYITIEEVANQDYKMSCTSHNTYQKSNSIGRVHYPLATF